MFIIILLHVFFLFSFLGPVTDHFTDCVNPIDVYLKYLDTEIIDNILYQYNLYITQKSSRAKPIDRREFIGFLGINTLMGYNKLPSWTHFWSSQPDLGVPFAATVIPRNRFAEILSNLHVNDNLVMPKDNNDRLYKLRPLIKSLNNRYVKLYNVSKQVSIDESMILFKGRSSLKQYNPMKPIKRGYKLWMRADMDGYISKFDVYQGRNTMHRDDNLPACFGLGESVIAHFTSDLAGKNHHVYFDNYFSSVPLVEYLKTENIFACGTIRSNRKYLPSNLTTDKVMNRGDFDYRVSSQEIVYFKWKDNKPVHIISNFHKTEKTKLLRRQRDGSRVEFPCPTAVKDYNAYMGGVDKADMLCSIYGLSRKSKKWWHRILFGALGRTLCNAYVVYKKHIDPSMNSLEFHCSIAQSLITLSKPPKVGQPLSTPSHGSATKRRKVSYSVPDSIRLQNIGVHCVTFVSERGRCEVCSKKRIQSRPHSKCYMCNVFLCCNEKKNCFREFHNL